MKKYITSLFACLMAQNSFGLGVNLNEAKTIKSDRIEYNVKSEEIRATGNTEMINESGQRVKLNDVSLTKEKTSFSANEIELWLGNHVYVQADSITRDGAKTVAHDAMFTACDGCDSFGHAWEIYGKKITHDSDEKMLYFYSPSFWVYNGYLPLLWFPYYEMPDPSVKYKTGFLDPSFGSTNKMGTQINLPFYINISEQHDITPTLSILTKENPLFQIEHRLNAEHSEYRTNAAFTHNKDGENRWYVFNDDTIELGENARASIYVQRTSDKTFLQKYGFYNYEPYLDSGAKLELFGQSSYVVADTHIFQELREPTGNQTISSGNILPNIRGTYQSDPFFRETYLTVSGDILGVSNSSSASQRIIGETRIVSPWTLWGGNRLTASVSARYDIYNFEKSKIYDDNNLVESYTGAKTRFLPSGYVEWGLPLFDVKNDWTYIIEPKARLTIMQHNNSKSLFAYNNDSASAFLSDTTLFSNNRYSGYDLWENGNFADYGVRWAAINKNHNLEVFLGQTYDFTNSDEPDFNNNGFRNGFSDYVGRLNYQYKYLQLSSRFRVDRTDMALNHIENSIYAGSENTFLSLGHIWDTHPIDVYSDNNKDTHEAVASAGLQLTKRLSVRGYLYYNVYEHVFQRHSAGIYYNHPCFFMSFQYRRDNAIKEDYVGGTTFQFKFGMSIDSKHY